ncbi:MAG: murein biosynthesis integral membrane protein MurJ [Anaerovoracaceae bacterium]|nr:murein biosynthesis integral membrane protein MurJ [Anaerovoracaceae bacterium]
MTSLTKAAVWVFIINIASKIFGLLKESIIAYKFGTSYIVDAYTIAIAFPSIIFAIFAGGLMESFVPVITRIDENANKNKFVNNVIIIMSIMSIIMTVLCIVFSDRIVDILAPGFSGECRELSESFISLISLMLLPMVLFSILAGYLNSKEKFIIVNVCNFIVANIVIIISIIVATYNHPNILIFGHIFSYIIPLIIVWIYAERRTFFRFVFFIDIRSKYIKELLQLAIPLGLSLIVNQINAMISRAIASTLGTGVVSALNYADKVQLIFYSLVASVMISVCFPRINKCFAKDDYSTGMKYIAKGFMVATLIGIPAAVVLFFFAEPITNLIFERGSFDSNSTYITAGCLAFYAIGIPFYSYREILLRGLSASKKQKLILKNTVIAIGFNILLCFAFVGPLKHIGVALATSISGIIASALMYYDLHKLKLKLFNSIMLIDILKICICTVFMVIAGMVIYNFLEQMINETLALIASAILMMALYGLGIIIFKVNIFRWMLNSILKNR